MMIKKFITIVFLSIFYALPACFAGEYEDLNQKCTELPDGVERLTICQKCLELNPNDAQVNWIVGKVYAHKHEIEMALKYYTKAVALAPDSVLANFTLASCYETESTAPARAHEFYERTLALNPDPLKPQEKFILKMTYQGLGNSYHYDRKEFDKAIVNYKKSYEIEKNDFICEKIASSYKELKDYTSELRWRNEAIDINGSDSSHYSLRGSAYFNIGEREKAIADYEKAIDLDPSQPYPYNNLALLYAKDRETIAEAIKYYELAYSRYNDESEKVRTKQMIGELNDRLAAPPSVEEIAGKSGLPTERDEFEKLLEDHKYKIDTAQYNFSVGDEAKAYETLEALKGTHLRIDNFLMEYNKYIYGTKSEFEYYLKQAAPRIGDLLAWYDKVQDDYRSKKEENRLNMEKAPQEIAERYKDSEKTRNHEYILKTLESVREWKVVTDFRKFFDSPYVSLRGQADDLVFNDLPLDAAAHKKDRLIIYAKINSRIDDSFVISNSNAKEALADIPKKLASKSDIKYGEYYHMVCNIVDIVTVSTIGGSQKPVALIKVDGIIKEDEYKQFARYVAGHPHEFPYKKYLLIENIVN
jgi:tetratricopeptide (TPR) repeat protein